MGVVSNNRFDGVLLSIIYMFKTLMLTDAQTPFLGTPFCSSPFKRFSRAALRPRTSSPTGCAATEVPPGKSTNTRQQPQTHWNSMSTFPLSQQYRYERQCHPRRRLAGVAVVPFTSLGLAGSDRELPGAQGDGCGRRITGMLSKS